MVDQPGQPWPDHALQPLLLLVGEARRVAEAEGDMRALIAGAVAAASPEPVSFLLPVRQSGLFRWCLAEGMRVVKPMALMVVGEYREPGGVWFPSVLY